jgi:hypothetical protein
MAGTAGVGLTPEALVMLISNLQNTGLCSVKFSSFDLFFAISPVNSFELYQSGFAIMGRRPSKDMNGRIYKRQPVSSKA